MKRILFSLILGSSIATSAMASEAKGDSDAGKSKAAACAACHGAEGNSASAAFPKIAGQGERYLYKQLRDFKSGERDNAIMAGTVANLNDQDMRDLAAYFASQSGSIGMANAELVKAGEAVYRAGNSKTNVPACMACHMADGAGNSLAGFPSLQGQHADYIEAQLKAFRAGTRANDGSSSMMRDIAFKMNDNEIKAVAQYITGLH